MAVAVSELRRWPVTVEDYDAMVAAGILEGRRVELIEGEIVEMPPIGPAHNRTVNWLTKAFVLAVGDRAIVGPHGGVRLPPLSEPEPDIALLAPKDDEYSTQLPGPDDILLLVEVGDASARTDRTIKVPVYAKAGITELWLVDFLADRIVQHRTPVGGVRGHPHLRTRRTDRRRRAAGRLARRGCGARPPVRMRRSREIAPTAPVEAHCTR